MRKRRLWLISGKNPGAFFAILISVFSGACSYSQINGSTPRTGNWVMYFGQFRLHDKWSIHSEFQFRDYGVAEEPEQLLFRTGINYHFSPSTSFTAGIARIENYGFDGEIFQSPIVSESRLWQQFQRRNHLGRIAFDHRYRIEQRWLQRGNDFQYLNRIRYFLRGSFPLNSIVIEKNTVFLSFYNEIFIRPSNSPFDRNRFYGGFGYQFHSSANFQTGLMAQTHQGKTKTYLQFAVFFNPDFRRKDQQ